MQQVEVVGDGPGIPFRKHVGAQPGHQVSQETRMKLSVASTGNTSALGCKYDRRKDLDALGYDGIHRRLYTDRGSASFHTCEHCGAPAYRWSCTRIVKFELSYRRGRGTCGYSPNIYDDYCALCKDCDTTQNIHTLAQWYFEQGMLLGMGL